MHSTELSLPVFFFITGFLMPFEKNKMIAMIKSRIGSYSTPPKINDMRLVNKFSIFYESINKMAVRYERFLLHPM
jgi:hypothetical protein